MMKNKDEKYERGKEKNENLTVLRVMKSLGGMRDE